MTQSSTVPPETLTRSYALDDSLMFARISGDSNPLHVDPLAARRTVFGKPVVHGMHLVIDGLQHLSQRLGSFRLVKLTGSFQKPVTTGDTVNFVLQKREEQAYRITVECGRQVAFFDVWFVVLPEAAEFVGSQQQPYVQLQTLNLADVTGAQGQIPAVIDASLFAERFPGAARCIPQQQLTDLVVTSTLVGMECPGEHSLYSRFRFTFPDPADGDGGNRLAYQVSHLDSRFRMATISVQAASLEGQIVAFVRPEPTSQLRMADAIAAVRSDEFAGVNALVVGGSRGLGEIAAKLLAAGGASVTLSWSRGREDACRVQGEIAALGGKAECIELDVTDERRCGWSHNASRPISVLYFATPLISAGTGSFSFEKFQQFCRYYIDGVSRLLATLQGSSGGVSHLLVPSTSFLDRPVSGMAEYSAAKAAAEALCRNFEMQWDGLRVATPRWPKMQTDQTAAMIPEVFANAQDTVLGSLRELFTESVTEIKRG